MAKENLKKIKVDVIKILMNLNIVVSSNKEARAEKLEDKEKYRASPDLHSKKGFNFASKSFFFNLELNNEEKGLIWKPQDIVIYS